MAQLVDAKSSQNASYANSISVPVLATAQQIFAQLTLSTAGATGPLNTLMTGTLTVQLPILPVATTVTLTIVRGTNVSDLEIYSVSENLTLSVLGPQVISFTASDFNVPIPGNGQITYTAFISANVLGTVRVGPESFNAAIYS
ncbi:hypothetical protein ABEY50_14970 [Priestia megaterium]|jgi:hypothetical protein|uniref:Uncharacterized protein n=1 Tax=Priestia aryabhattai TaxID=412384 RepID=A0ABD7X6B2_PRIAR|nr:MULTISPECIES: hypothetical protein [Priestia]RCX20767.1 hypothetical protein DEU47_10824 [Bacillus sp. AG236]MCM3155477.1 hypothetical protein [Priestia megaterium]MEB2294619.1 hypothetical protein [Priestia megaterium]PEU71809.1 hypothetical protein CN397_08625 [Priestia megaterium]PEZ07341.1 hypothetical protein CN330_25920 [Priestia megaterium]